jgi:hypothetical protein
VAVPNVLEPLYAAILACDAALGRFGAPYAFIGGVAVGLLSEPRTTRDVDALLWLEDDERLPDLLRICGELGITPRLSQPDEFARRSRILPMVHVPSGVTLDIALAILPFEEQAIRGARRVEFMGLILPLPQPENLAVMKAVAGRPQDILDLTKLVARLSQPEVKKVRKLENPAMIEALDQAIGSAGLRAGRQGRRRYQRKRS